MRSLGGTLQRLCRFFSLRMIASAAVLSLYVRLFLLLGCLVVSLSPFHSPPLPLSLSVSLSSLSCFSLFSLPDAVPPSA